MNATQKPITPAQIRELNYTVADRPNASRVELVASLGEKIAHEDTFHATMNRSSRSAAERAEEIVAKYENASDAERAQARATADKIRRELGSQPHLWVV